MGNLERTESVALKPILGLGILAFSIGAFAAQQDPAHPWPSHEPPEDYACVPARSQTDVNSDVHACACLGMLNDPMCGESEAEMETRVDSSACKAWCKPKQCQCRRQCEES